MSQENVEVVRNANEAFRRGDWEAFATSVDPHILIRADPSWPEQRVYGREAMLHWVRGLRESLGSDMRIEEIEDLGDRLLIRMHWHTHGQHSAIETDLHWSEIVTIREGRTAFAELFLEHEQALKARAGRSRRCRRRT